MFFFIVVLFEAVLDNHPTKKIFNSSYHFFQHPDSLCMPSLHLSGNTRILEIPIGDKMPFTQKAKLIAS